MLISTEPTAAADRALAEYPARVNLAERLVASRRDSQRTSFRGPGFQLTFQQLDRLVRRQAAGLCRQGVARDERILIALDDGPELAVMFFAALAMGALPVVLNPRLDAAAIAHLLADARPALCIVQPAQAELWAAAPGVNTLDAGACMGWLEASHPDDLWCEFTEKPAQAPVLIQYTSGSTGQPKGVIHSARSLLACCEDFAVGQLGLNEHDVVYSVPKAFFGYGMGNSLFFPLYVGACAVMDGAWPSAERVRAVLREHRPTVLFAVPAVYGMLLEDAVEPQALNLRLAFSAGAPLPANLIRRWQQRYRPNLHDGIGSTELCHIFATSYPDALQPGKVGRMLPGWHARIVDAAGNDVATGESGVLLVKAPSMAVGYWERPEQQAARFKAGWYCTGDLFSQDPQGLLTFHGREDDRFKVFGRWVAPVEIENLLISLMPDLRDCYLVAGCTDEECRPVLFVRANGAADDLVQQVETLMHAHLESYKRPVHIAVPSEIPLNRNGKPDRKALARLADQLLRGAAEVRAC
ncbi:AMP-binding protein [Pseudomonas fontis]|uniref:AMP-binding protein n=1 Tax=Pseudomonas fontis TaxID=2942633 RepID=A0ABT5NNG7_9PSED|nr:AMP-binding protein [Pseudomonas fontis]MDD0973174.1 AMP-binding protein [Pseudomonas fontis]MDD0989694.1 AMP-binding protein [Pseudomonas fontis]